VANVSVKGNVSSQYLTGLLLAAPLLGREVNVRVEGELISKPYVEITLNLMRRFGVEVKREGWQRFTVPAATYQSPGRIAVEGDASSASYFLAAGAIGHGPVGVEGVGRNSIQGDVRFAEALARMGAEISFGPNWVECRLGCADRLHALDLDCNHIPDAAMTLAILALFADGPTTLKNIASWRVKETDRIAAMAAELRKLGAAVVAGWTTIEVTPPAALTPAAIHTYDDHRVAMCFSLAAFAGVPVRILDPKCVAKTFPDYFEALFDLVRTPVEAVPVITVDGPTASGKGTLASAVAKALGYHFLDSGAVYRATALTAMRIGVAPDDEASLARIAATLPLHFLGGDAHLGDENVADALRAENVGAMASKVSAWPAVREALRQLQLSFRRIPGLVADGRDMGTVIFPSATLKVFLTASAATRAERRYKQLISKGIPANISTLRAELEARDERDRNRSVAPLKPAEDALLLDNSELTVEASMEQVLEAWEQRRPFG